MITKLPHGKKKCPKCKSVKDIEDFPKRPDTVDGHDGYCKICRKEINDKVALQRKEDRRIFRELF